MRRSIFLLAICFSTAAMAAPAGSVNFTAPLHDEGGHVLVDNFACPIDPATHKRECDTPLTLGMAVYYALMMPDKGLSWTDSLRRSDLAHAIRNAKNYPLLPVDEKVIEQVMPQLWGPSVIGQAAALFASSK